MLLVPQVGTRYGAHPNAGALDPGSLSATWSESSSADVRGITMQRALLAHALAGTVLVSTQNLEYLSLKT